MLNTRFMSPMATLFFIVCVNASFAQTLYPTNELSAYSSSTFNVPAVVPAVEGGASPVRLSNTTAETNLNFAAKIAAQAAAKAHAFEQSGQMTAAKQSYAEALELYKRLKTHVPVRFSADWAKLCLQAGTFYQTQDQAAEAENLYLQCLSVCEDMTLVDAATSKPMVAQAKVRLAVLAQYQDDNKQAQSYYRAALADYQEIVMPATNMTLVASGTAYMAIADVANPYTVDFYHTAGSLGLLCQQQGQMNDAQQLLKQSMVGFAALSEVNPKYRPHLAVACNNMAFYYKAAQNTTEAARYFAQASALYEASGSQFDSARSLVLQAMGTLYVQQGQFDQSEAFFAQAQSLRKKVNTSKR
jgi:tetratricopeptide (TPR) repeat protein